LKSIPSHVILVTDLEKGNCSPSGFMLNIVHEYKKIFYTYLHTVLPLTCNQCSIHCESSYQY